MGLYNRFCKRFFAAVIICLTAQSDPRAHDFLGFTYLQSIDFQREPQSKHHLYCEQEKPANCHGFLLLRLGTH